MNVSLEDLVTFRPISVVLILYTEVNGLGPKSVRGAQNQWFERIMLIILKKNTQTNKSENDHTKLAAWNQDFERGNHDFPKYLGKRP